VNSKKQAANLIPPIGSLPAIIAANAEMYAD
jgi:hypothetical protein